MNPVSRRAGGWPGLPPLLPLPPKKVCSRPPSVSQPVTANRHRHPQGRGKQQAGAGCPICGSHRGVQSSCARHGQRVGCHRRLRDQRQRLFSRACSCKISAYWECRAMRGLILGSLLLFGAGSAWCAGDDSDTARRDRPDRPRGADQGPVHPTRGAGQPAAGRHGHRERRRTHRDLGAALGIEHGGRPGGRQPPWRRHGGGILRHALPVLPRHAANDGRPAARRPRMCAWSTRILPILGPTSVLEARALLAAQRQGGYLKLQDAVMHSAAPSTVASLRAEAEHLGMDGARLEKDMADPAIQARLDANIRLAAALHVDGTPALVGGRPDDPGRGRTRRPGTRGGGSPRPLGGTA